MTQLAVAQSGQFDTTPTAAGFFREDGRTCLLLLVMIDLDIDDGFLGSSVVDKVALGKSWHFHLSLFIRQGLSGIISKLSHYDFTAIDFLGVILPQLLFLSLVSLEHLYHVVREMRFVIVAFVEIASVAECFRALMRTQSDVI